MKTIRTTFASLLFVVALSPVVQAATDKTETACASTMAEALKFPLLAQSCTSSTQCGPGYHCRFGNCAIDSGGAYQCQGDFQCTYPERCVSGSCR